MTTDHEGIMILSSLRFLVAILPTIDLLSLEGF